VKHASLTRSLLLALLFFIFLGASCPQTIETAKDRSELISLYGTLAQAKKQSDPALIQATKTELSALGKRAFERVSEVKETTDKIFLYYIASNTARIVLDQDVVQTYSKPGEALCEKKQPNGKLNFELAPTQCILIASAPVFTAAEIVTVDLKRFELSEINDREEIKKSYNNIRGMLGSAITTAEKLSDPNLKIGKEFRDAYANRTNKVYCWYLKAAVKYSDQLNLTEAADLRINDTINTEGNALKDELENKLKFPDSGC